MTVAEAETLRCPRCKQMRPLAMFYLEAERRITRRAKRQRMNCRICQRERNDARRGPATAYVNAIKLAGGCTDCGIRSDHPEIYDFDHLPGQEKVTTIAVLVNLGNIELIDAEIAKCEIVCANCHRIRTKRRIASQL
jgi:hypothetical protein